MPHSRWRSCRTLVEKVQSKCQKKNMIPNVMFRQRNTSSAVRTKWNALTLVFSRQADTTHTWGIHVKSKTAIQQHRREGIQILLKGVGKNIWWDFLFFFRVCFQYINPSLLTGNSTIIKKHYIRRNILHLWGSKTRIKRFHLRKKNVSTCAHVLCDVNTTGILFLWDFRKSNSALLDSNSFLFTDEGMR